MGLDLARTGFSKGYEMGSRLFIFERRIRFMELTTDHSFSSCHRRPRPPPSLQYLRLMKVLAPFFAVKHKFSCRRGDV